MKHWTEYTPTFTGDDHPVRTYYRRRGRFVDTVLVGSKMKTPIWITYPVVGFLRDVWNRITNKSSYKAS